MELIDGVFQFSMATLSRNRLKKISQKSIVFIERGLLGRERRSIIFGNCRFDIILGPNGKFNTCLKKIPSSSDKTISVHLHNISSNLE